jgi:hypothetical protein
LADKKMRQNKKSEHFPAKWIPVGRQGNATKQEIRAFSGQVDTGWPTRKCGKTRNQSIFRPSGYRLADKKMRQIRKC